MPSHQEKESKPRLLFISFWSFDDAQTNGITKKLVAQCEAFTKLGFSVSRTYCQGGGFWYETEENKERLTATRRFTTRIASALALTNKLRQDEPRYDCAYIRYAQADWGLLALVKELKRQGVSTLIEIPTYPYEKEFQTGLLRCSLAIDRLYRERVASHVDRFVIYAEDECVYGRPTLRTKNGVAIDSVSLAPACPHADGIIRLIGVAAFAPRHGYDRLLAGLGNYIRNGGTRQFHIRLVGEGSEAARYKTIVWEQGLDRFVTFSGFLGGDKLDAAYAEAELAIDSLGVFRIGQSYSTSLKYFESLLRGLPILTTGHGEDGSPLERYTLRVTANEEPIDMERVANFYDDIYGRGADRLEIRKRIRQLAEPLCAMETTLLPIRDYWMKNRKRD